MYVVLDDRTLWFDGDFTVKSTEVEKFIINGNTNGLYVDELTDEIIKYNSLVQKEQKIDIKKDVKPFDLSWNIPNEYKNLNVHEYIYSKLEQQNIQDDELYIRVKRVIQELKLFEQYDIINLIRVLIYIINTFYTNNIVWGIGRGSSTSSYILYLIGVHDVDSVLYDLDVHDFIHA